MAGKSNNERTRQYAELSTRIAGLGDDEVGALLSSTEASNGWGRHQTIEVGDATVFVKRVSVTALEMANVGSTRNLYGLPTYYNYGVGSAGFGVWRELSAHTKTTEWVLAGECANFPLMYHHRIMPFSGERVEVAAERVRGYVEYWNGQPSVEALWAGRAAAEHELVIFLEHVPLVLHPWLLDHPAQIQATLDELRSTITFLRTHGMIHFDAHFYNILTDGERPYVTDFGLVLAEGFDLGEEERGFFEQHRYYDYSEVLWSAGNLLVSYYDALSEDGKRAVLHAVGAADGRRPANLVAEMARHIEHLAGEGLLPVAAELVEVVVRYGDVICLFDEFLVGMRANKRKDTPFPHDELKRLLERDGFAD